MPPVASTMADEAIVIGFAVTSPVLRTCKPVTSIAFRQQRFGNVALDHADRWRFAHGFDQRRNDGFAGHVALDVNDAPRGVSRLTADSKLSFQIAVERHAVGEKIVDAGAGLPGKPERDLFIDDAAAHRHRVGGVGFRAVAFGNRCGNAALGPGAGGAFAKRGR